MNFLKDIILFEAMLPNFHIQSIKFSEFSVQPDIEAFDFKFFGMMFFF